MKLQGEFKLITTGTPIENHLGELWNLFRFINPGLLGSRERFNQRFAQAIEKDKDKQARQQLKKLIQPFLLRRTKNQVLTELLEKRHKALVFSHFVAHLQIIKDYLTSCYYLSSCCEKYY